GGGDGGLAAPVRPAGGGDAGVEGAVGGVDEGLESLKLEPVQEHPCYLAFALMSRRRATSCDPELRRPPGLPRPSACERRAATAPPGCIRPPADPPHGTRGPARPPRSAGGTIRPPTPEATG